MGEKPHKLPYMWASSTRAELRILLQRFSYHLFSAICQMFSVIQVQENSRVKASSGLKRLLAISVTVYTLCWCTECCCKWSLQSSGVFIHVTSPAVTRRLSHIGGTWTSKLCWIQVRNHRKVVYSKKKKKS